MKRKTKQFAAGLIVLALCVPMVLPARAAGVEERTVQVGLAYGSGALINGNLQNNTGYGAGYRLGYFDKNLKFVELARTDDEVTELTVLKTQNTWVKGGSYSNEDNGGKAIGCYHIQIPGTYASYEDAVEDAELYDGFVAWIDGEYQVRVGAYVSKEGAEGAQAVMGQGKIVGTTGYAVTVTETGTDRILFQFDGGAAKALGVMPDVTGADEVRTWCKGYRYQGGFRYERVDGGDLTVVNIVDMEDYIKGVIPYEMANDWPLEALKVQAVCARSYGYNNIKASRHKSSHFDVCTTDHCQVYHGVGTSKESYQANKTTDRAVDKTAGEYAWYNGSPIEAFYASSHGGASESAYYIWGTNMKNYPYLCGVVDPYEATIADKNARSSWTVRYTAQELTKRVQSYGYGVGTTVDRMDLTYSELGNVIQVKVRYENGQSNTFTPRSKPSIKNLFGLDSIHFTVNGQTLQPGESKPDQPAGGGSFAVNGSGSLDSLEGVYAISGSGDLTKLGEKQYAITGKGKVQELIPDLPEEEGSSGGSNEGGGTVTVSGKSYVFDGGGWGHQIGMSQYGARAMVELGFSYDEIIEFYFPGTYVE